MGTRKKKIEQKKKSNPVRYDDSVAHNCSTSLNQNIHREDYDPVAPPEGQRLFFLIFSKKMDRIK